MRISRRKSVTTEERDTKFIIAFDDLTIALTIDHDNSN